MFGYVCFLGYLVFFVVLRETFRFIFIGEVVGFRWDLI